MAFQAVVPAGGYLGWRFLQKTAARQTAELAASPAERREAEYFRANIGRIGTAAELVADRRLLRTALDAFGLGADLPNRAFIQRVLEGGALDPRSLANRLTDKRYLELTRAFGFGDFALPNTRLSDFPDRILAALAERRFEAAVGERDQTLRLALGGRRELAALAARNVSDETQWFTIMGTPPLRRLFETAFGLPASFAAIDIDRQLVVLREKAAAAFGDSRVAQFRDPERMEALIRRFLTRAEAAAPAAGAVQAGAAGLLQILAARGPRG